MTCFPFVSEESYVVFKASDTEGIDMDFTFCSVFNLNLQKHLKRLKNPYAFKTETKVPLSYQNPFFIMVIR